MLLDDRRSFAVEEIAQYADELLVCDNTAHRHGFRVVAHFIRGKLSKTRQMIPDASHYSQFSGYSALVFAFACSITKCKYSFV